jgi:UDP-GlcNAc:undecaprenyl-phosphate GlcNAc-1-phosphate transferase
MTTLVLTAAIAFVAAVVLVRLVMAGATRVGAIVDPSDERWGTKRVPKIGGLGIAGAIVIASLLAPGVDTARIAVVLAIVAASALGLADDLGSVSPRARLAVQAVIGLGLGAAIGADLGAGVIAMAILGLIGVIVLANATNLVDNADGLAASLTCVSALTISGIALAAESSDLAPIVPMAIAGATFGFLAWNRPPARIFMGDCGSLMLGAALAGAGLSLLHDAIVSGSSASLILLAIPVAVVMQAGDVALVIVSRVRRGADPMRGGVDHTSHRLLRAGLGPWRMLGVIVAPAALAGATIVGSVRTEEAAVVALVAVVIIVLVVLGEAWLARLVPYPFSPLAASPGLALRRSDPPEAT